MYGNGDAGAGVDLGDLLHAQRITQGIAACAAIFLRVGNAEEAVLLHLRQKLQIIGFLFVHLLGQRLDLRLRKAAEQLLLEKMGLVQFEIHNYLLKYHIVRYRFFFFHLRQARFTPMRSAICSAWVETRI